MKSFRDLKVWEKSHHFALRVYRQSKSFPREENYGLTSQIRRAAVSVPSNLEEGCGHGGDGELGRYCGIAMGSACEVGYQLLLAKDLGNIDDTNYDQMNRDLNEIQRMLNGLIKTIRNSNT
ncbi:MAG: four helix bundle protein [Planctomycetota bacterium]